MKLVLPGSTLGILGGGQLGRMTAMAARALGYQVHALDPDAECPAAPVVDRLVVAPFDDADAARALAEQCDVVTLEIEKIGRPSMEAARRFAPTRPSLEVLEVIQDKGRQKHWLVQHGFPVGPFQDARSQEGIAQAVAALGGRCFVKACQGGYDGRGQVRVQPGDDVGSVWGLLGKQTCIVEQAIDLEAEISVMVARSALGATAVYPPALNHHVDQILDWSLLPAPLPEALAKQAVELSRQIAQELKIEGVLAVELFVTRDGKLLVNELAPRPHNTFHATEMACPASQFEQLVRAVTGLPLGSVEVMRPVAVANLLGDLWLGPSPARFDAALEVPGTRLHLYGKRQARPGRKMGHLSAMGSTPEEALERVKRARARLSGKTSE